MTVLDDPGVKTNDKTLVDDAGLGRRITPDPSRKRPSVLQRIVVVALVALAAWHAAATFLIVAPRTAIRDAIPAAVLDGYAYPMFGQVWNVFAPDPISGDYRLSVRAIVKNDDGSTEVTGWVEAMSTEATMLSGNLMPPRAASVAHHQSLNSYLAYFKLTEAQRQIVFSNFYEGDDWAQQLQSSLESVEGASAETDAYLWQEWRATAYATQVAQAMWGKDAVQQVQYEVSQKSVVPFEYRDDPDAQGAITTIATGWRGTIVRDGQDDQAFADIFRSLNPKEEKRDGDE